MPPEQKYRLGDVLVDQGLISFSQLGSALKQQKVDKQRIGKTLVKMNAVEERDVIRALARQAVYNKQIDPNPKQELSMSRKARPLSEWLTRAALLFGVIASLIIAFVAITNGWQTVSTNQPINKDQHKPLQTFAEIKVLPSAPAAPKTIIAPSPNLNGTNSAATTISKVEVYESFLQKHFIFYSQRSLINNVRREYLDNNWVSYYFDNITIEQLPTLKASGTWLNHSQIEQTDAGVHWRFQLRKAGSAKFHELAPEQSETEYKLIVVIRTWNNASDS